MSNRERAEELYRRLVKEAESAIGKGDGDHLARIAEGIFFLSEAIYNFRVMEREDRMEEWRL